MFTTKDKALSKARNHVKTHPFESVAVMYIGNGFIVVHTDYIDEYIEDGYKVYKTYNGTHC